MQREIAVEFFEKSIPKEGWVAVERRECSLERTVYFHIKAVAS